MAKYFQVFVTYTLLLVFSESLKLFSKEKIPINSDQPPNKVNENSQTIEIGVNPKDNQEKLFGLKATFTSNPEFKDSRSNIFVPKKIEQESSFSNLMVDKNQQNLLTSKQIHQKRKHIFRLIKKTMKRIFLYRITKVFLLWSQIIIIEKEKYLILMIILLLLLFLSLMIIINIK